MTIKPLTQWLKDRIKERSTQATLLTVVAGCFGVVITPEQSATIATLVATVVSTIAVGTKEGQK